ncbi:MAG TPA: TatD family hydrolase [Jiangellales bacterium]|nr:TatD family hydrolase [Jiangellales bacterium]
MTHPRSSGGPGRPPAPEPLPRPVVDSHCHLDVARGEGEPAVPLDRALAEAAAVGVDRVVQIGCDLAGARWAVEAARSYGPVVAGVALHPTEATAHAQAGTLDGALAEVEALAVAPEVRAVGETGLDHYWVGPEGRPAQEESFRAHVTMARRLGKALVVHDRDAHDDVIRVLEDAGPPQTVVFHCFSGDAAMARHCVERGWYLSFAGPVTFRNAAALRDALAEVPLEQVLVETDAPYLTPHPYRGRPNAPYLLPHTVRTVAEVLGRDLAEVCDAVSANAERVFGTW